MANVKESEQRVQAAIQTLTGKGRFTTEKSFLHHRQMTVYDHSVHVAEVSLAMANFLPFSFDTDSLVRGALLHDYFLYHRNESVKTYVLHGYRHPVRLCCSYSRSCFNANGTLLK